MESDVAAGEWFVVDVRVVDLVMVVAAQQDAAIEVGATSSTPRVEVVRFAPGGGDGASFAAAPLVPHPQGASLAT